MIELLWYIYSYYCSITNPYNVYYFTLKSFSMFLKDIKMYKIIDNVKSSIMFYSVTNNKNIFLYNIIYTLIMKII